MSKSRNRAIEHISNSNIEGDIQIEEDGRGHATLASPTTSPRTPSGGVQNATNDLSERYDSPSPTIYFRLGRFEHQSIEETFVGQNRPGRPTRFGDEERPCSSTHPFGPPTEQGTEAPEWTPEATCGHIRDVFGVEYSLGHVRLLREAETGAASE